MDKIVKRARALLAAELTRAGNEGAALYVLLGRDDGAGGDVADTAPRR